MTGYACDTWVDVRCLDVTDPHPIVSLWGNYGVSPSDFLWSGWFSKLSGLYPYIANGGAVYGAIVGKSRIDAMLVFLAVVSCDVIPSKEGIQHTWIPDQVGDDIGTLVTCRYNILIYKVGQCQASCHCRSCF